MLKLPNDRHLRSNGKIGDCEQSSEFTNEQLNDNLRDRFICGLRSQHVKQKLLSKNFTFQEAVNEANAQEAARKDIKDIADSYGGETTASGDSGGVNDVTCDN